MKIERRYDIDWIRVLAFDILIIYHIGMFFVPWGWHIKNNDIANWMVYPMSFVNQWRLPILFVVSGMGTRFALSYKSGANYIKERFIRLFVPLVAGVLLIISLSIYIERLSQGKISGSFFEWYPQFFQGLYPEGNFHWTYLWFLPYLLVMSVIATPLFLNLRKKDNRIIIFIRNQVTKSPFSLFLFAIPLLIPELLLQPYFPMNYNLIGDWYILAFYFILFITGFIFISLGKSFWIALDKVKFYSLITGIACFVIGVLLVVNKIETNIGPVIKTLNMWSWILTIFGFSSKYINRESNFIKYRNQAVYPFYILHQTIIILIGFFLMYNPMHYMWKFIIMVIGTYLFAWLIYEFIIRRISIISPLFGVKKKLKTTAKHKINAIKTGAY